jgi:hypothetical protein
MSSINNIKAITKRELAGYFSSPVAYVFIIIFLLLTGSFTFLLGGFFEYGQASLERSFFMWFPWLFLFLVPAVGMRLWAEERRVGTLAADAPYHGLAGHCGKISRVVDFPAAGLGADFSGDHHGQLSWLAGQRRDSGLVFRQFSHGRVLFGD